MEAMTGLDVALLIIPFLTPPTPAPTQLTTGAVDHRSNTARTSSPAETFIAAGFQRGPEGLVPVAHLRTIMALVLVCALNSGAAANANTDLQTTVEICGGGLVPPYRMWFLALCRCVLMRKWCV